MGRLSAWWARERWGPLASTTDYHRERIEELVDRGSIPRPTEEELRLAEAYLSWRRRQLWRSMWPTSLLVVALVGLVPVTRPHVWTFAFILLLGNAVTTWRTWRVKGDFASKQ